MLNQTTLEDGYITATGTVQITSGDTYRGEMHSDFIEVKPNTTYAFSIIETGDNYPNWFGIGEYVSDNESSFIQRDTSTNISQNYITFTTNERTNYVRVSARNLANSTKVQLEEGNRVTSYSEYNPIELNSSPDGTIRDQIVGSSDVSYNLYKTVNKTLSQNGIDITIENGVITLNGTSTGSFDLFLNSSNGLYSLKSGEYTFSTKVISGSYSGTVGKYVRNNSTSSNIIDGGLIDATRTRTIEANDNCLSYIYIGNNAVFNNYKVIIQLNEGSEVKPYAPYGQVGMWWKREYIGKVVLDGSETWYKANENINVWVNNLANSHGIDRKYTNSRGDFLCNYFSYLGDAQTENFGNAMSFNVSNAYKNSLYIQIDTNIASSNVELKNWLSAHNTTVWYQKAQYTDIPITDTTLINQLNDIYNNAHSYNGVTNITTTYEDGNEQMYLDIEALKNVWEVTE